jgi:hypothetical protein
MIKKILRHKDILLFSFVMGLGIISIMNNFLTNAYGCGGPICPPCEHWDGSKCTGCQTCSCNICDTSGIIPECKICRDRFGSCSECESCAAGCKPCGLHPPCYECVGQTCQYCGGRVCEACDDETHSCKPVKLKSYTMAQIPDDIFRTTIGIGEAVRLFTDPPYPVRLEKISGDGYFDSYRGIYVAPMKPETACFQAIHYYGSTECDTITFSVIAPSSLTYEKDYENPPWATWSSGIKYLGASMHLNVTVNPTSVSFVNAAIQENFGLVGTTSVWPDGTIWYSPTGIFGPVYLLDGNIVAYGDLQESGLYDSNKLYTGSQWMDFCSTNPIPIEYLNDLGIGVEFYTSTAIREYYQADRKSVVGVGGIESVRQGPWQGP